jgi:uncharacterized membrane protein YciS (DUF1049 family)
MTESAIWAMGLLGILGMACTLLVCGVVVPRSALRDMRRERDYYREAAQSCAGAISHVQQQFHQALDTMNSMGKMER